MKVDALIFGKVGQVLEEDPFLRLHSLNLITMSVQITITIIVPGMDTRHVFVRAHWRWQNGRKVFVRGHWRSR
ncbi:MAG: YXWGXW repeat-containing protein [Bacteroidales bacterium]|nr:YXWGXW repeat-containing protein [Bacteroidales bacterium]